jgi:hypothetical protein
MNTGREPGQRGHALSVDRVIAAAPEAIFDGFVTMYDSQRPDWVTDSQLDLREGGRWTVAFQVPDGPVFREERVLTGRAAPPDRLRHAGGIRGRARLRHDRRGHDRGCASRAAHPAGAAGIPHRASA